MYFRHLTGVLSAARCAELIELGQTLGFQAAPVNFHGEQKRMDSIRNNDRCEWDDLELAVELDIALQNHLNDEFPHTLNGEPYAGLGSHFRMYRYRPGQYFKPHKDGSVELADCESAVTALFYLNDTDGGETLVMPYGPGQPWANKSFAPRTGDALIFEHKIWHSGQPVHSGEKLVLRTDLFYQRLVAPL